MSTHETTAVAAASGAMDNISLDGVIAMFDLETNKAIALRLVEVFNGRRLDLLEDVLHPEFRGRVSNGASILDEAAATIGGWTALQSIRCVHVDSEGQDWEPWQAHVLCAPVREHLS